MFIKIISKYGDGTPKTKQFMFCFLDLKTPAEADGVSLSSARFVEFLLLEIYHC